LIYFYSVIEEGEKVGESISLKEPTIDDIHIIGYTSGTTGTPKGVMSTHSNMIAS
jgi:long-chain acyl-CoA synthetase